MPAVPPISSSMSAYDNLSVGDSFGYLIDLINRLAAKGGLDAIAKKVESGKLEAQVQFVFTLRDHHHCQMLLFSGNVCAVSTVGQLRGAFERKRCWTND